MSKYRVVSGPYFPVFGLNTEIYSAYLLLDMGRFFAGQHYIKTSSSTKMPVIFKVSISIRLYFVTSYARGSQGTMLVNEIISNCKISSSMKLVI